MRKLVRYYGQVQGVGFRATVRSIARGQAVTGFVRNEADGTVYLEVQGTAAAVEGLLGGVRSAMGGFIDREEPREIEEVGAERGFSIAR